MRILLIEDEKRLVESLSNILASRGDVSDVRNFESIRHEIQSMNLDVYRLVIIDCVSLSTDYLELCNDIHTQRKGLPIIVVTSSFNKEDEIAVFSVGASGYIARPFSADELHLKIRALMHKPIHKLDSVLAVGSLKLDSLNRRVTVGSRIIRLTKKEFVILELLMRNFDEVVSRKRIFENVWGGNQEVASNVIDVHIKNLRRKLKFKNIPKIETSHASGYRIMDR